MPQAVMDLNKAAQWAKFLTKRPKYAYKNSMRTIAGLIRSGKASHGKYAIPISAKQAFQKHQSMGGTKMKPLAEENTRTTFEGGKRITHVSSTVDRDKPLYRRKKTKGRGEKRRIVSRAVDTLYKIITKKSYKHKGGSHVEFFKGGEEPQMKFGGTGILPSVHHFGQTRVRMLWDSETKSRKPLVIQVPARPVLEVTPSLADAAANIMADETISLIDKGFF